MIKALFFDLDGTLINTNELILRSFEYTIKTHLNIDYDRKDIVKFFGEPLRTSLERLKEGNVDAMLQTYLTYNESNHDPLVSLFPGVLEGLKLFKALGYKLAIVTSKRRIMAERGLRLLEIIDLFDVIVTPENTSLHKPYKDPCVYALKALGLSCNEAMMVGDSPFDIMCGKAAGLKTCAVNYTLIPKEELEKAGCDYFVDSIKDIIDLSLEEMQKTEMAGS